MVKKNTQNIVELARPVVNLSGPSSKLAAIMGRIDNGEPLTDALQAEFHDTKLVEEKSIDETITFRGFLEALED